MNDSVVRIAATASFSATSGGNTSHEFSSNLPKSSDQSFVIISNLFILLCGHP